MGVSPSPVHVFLSIDAALPAVPAAVVLAVVGYAVTHVAIKYSRDAFVARGLSGRDLLKPWTDRAVPECMGLPAAAAYLFMLVLLVPVRYLGAETAQDPGELAAYLSALLSMHAGMLLGFVDDVLDVRWRYKLPIPFLASIPMLVVYIAAGGATSVVVPAFPPFLRDVLGTSVDFGVLYYCYMLMLATFCTNCINILAGINGVEVGQAIVIALSVCINDLLYLDVRGAVRGVFEQDEELKRTALTDVERRHLFSLNMLIPFVGVSAALLAWNRWPARVFVGDTYCYFAGMVLAAAGILGHYSKTLLLFFAPQVFNFVLSAPQLFAIVPCPRHRVPRFDDGALVPSCVYMHNSSPLAHGIVAVLEALRLVRSIRTDDGRVVGTTNFTLLNALLVLRGVRPQCIAPLNPPEKNKDPIIPVRRTADSPKITEHDLWRMVMGVQVLASLGAFAIRYWLAELIFP
ncbi:UDP-N-acetylglucosamine--dolichyl-phosphatN-acetylglucosaminephosphotransferase [Malassezia cuniculi]|uniref:UDP-N-acetylglucosamine--dolichyl-phosphate N-acetylglucosaminephosphotransferase n=1 Tax=Malassezia cuniculi TaxID=948313 RepID=A0AAF0ERB9_9BASI|nr:UDP-N-acetylglucosamine--dolichyl-phosphatN-acetylglucosaminephosphotransferase [Malassezia cuniculi]